MDNEAVVNVSVVGESVGWCVAGGCCGAGARSVQ